MTRIRFRQGTAAEWTSANPILTTGEPGFETDTGKEKIGDGTTAWVTLPYVTDTVEAALDVVTTALDTKADTSGLRVLEGSNAKQGVSTLVGGTVTVSNTSVTATSRIQLTAQSLGTVTVPMALAVTARIDATSFTITSADATDTSVVAWEIFEVFVAE